MTAILKVDTIQDTAGNNIINENANTITIGKAGDTTNIVGTLQNDGSALISGITMADSYRTSADVFKTGSSYITANWEQADTDSPGFIGSSMTQSGGVFTFPSTGIYLILANMYIVPDGVRTYSGSAINVTTNNGGSWSRACQTLQHTTAGGNYINASSHFILDVTDTSNVKVIFGYISDGSAIIAGSSTENLTVMSFIRLGDT